MKNIQFLVIVIATVIFASCSGDKAETTGTTESSGLETTQQTTDELPPSFTTTIEEQPINTTLNTDEAKTATGINPPHGEPGHRCDIEVGAPLSGAAKQTSPTPKTSITPTQPTTIIPQPAQTKTAAGTNPPHGQPGHRCDVAVGAPLN